MKVTVKSNVTFKKLKKANLEQLVFDSLIMPIGKAAKKKVEKSFKNNLDINEKPYAQYTAKYRKAKAKAGKGSNRMMVYDGTLKKSISRLVTDKSDMTVTVKSDDSQMQSKRGLNYGAYHLTGETYSNRKSPKIRKWFFTSDELKNNDILLKDNLLGRDFDKAMKRFSKKLESLLKTRMRIIGGRTMAASSNFARNLKV